MRSARKTPRRRSAKLCPEHLVWVRTLPCAVPSCLSREDSQACHVRQNTGAGMGMKPGDAWAVPMCGCHHREQHQIGHAAFDAKYGINLRKLAEELVQLSPFRRRL